MIKSPFNFVSLNSQVFFPDWADEISQDIPFSDGVSGTIGLSITADSPIYIRNGQLNKEEDSKDKEYSFSHVTTPKGNRYFIPGTSIKGEVRNIMEIMSYGRMFVDDRAQFARRDLHNKEVYSLMNKQKQEHCGWLRRKGEDYEIDDCGRFWRISHDEIDRFLGSPVMRREFSKERVIAFNDEDKTADYKYRLIENKSLFKEHTFEACGKNRMGDSLVKFSDGGSLRGTIVFTGQPSLWSEPLKYNKGKYYEFVFPERKEATRKISGDEFKHFEFIYKKTKGDKVSEDWKRIKRLLDESESGGRGVPVFFIPKGKEGIEHFGMAYLYKMPYDHSVFESLPEAHRHKDKRDLAECIFGYADKQDALKGRVQFGHAFASEAKPLERIRLVLGSPKASYYPLYVSQEGKDGVTADYNTYDHGTPSGWKRYYVRKDTNSVKDTGQDKVDTYMEPLDKGAKYRGTVSFHNLRPVELGALLSALTFHNTPECRHQLGMAKAYGFGKCRYNIKLNITAVSYDGQPKNAEYYMARFEDYMSRHVAGPWTQQQPIKELFTMAGNDVANGGAFDFMTMDLKTNEFEQAKTDHEYLRRATSLLQHIIAPKTLCDNADFKADLDAIIEKEKEEKAMNERRRKEQLAEKEKQRKIDEEKKARQKELETLRLRLVDVERRIGQASSDNYGLSIIRAELSGMETDDNGCQNSIANLIAMVDENMDQNRRLALLRFKEAYGQRIAQAGTDKGLLNNLKAELGNLQADDKDKQDIITGLLAEIDKTIALKPKEGFQDAFMTVPVITGYDMFEARVKAGKRKTPLDKLTQADKDFGAAKLQEAYDHDAKKSSKDWAVTTGRYFKKCVKIVGNDIATEWFTKLKR